MSAVRKLCNVGLLLTAGVTNGPAGVEETIQAYLGRITASERVLDLTKAKHDIHALQTARFTCLSVDDNCSLAYGETLTLHLDVVCDPTMPASERQQQTILVIGEILPDVLAKYGVGTQPDRRAQTSQAPDRCSPRPR